ncbi:MAG: HD domain-containing protein [Deltaproteobacteria bacterium]|nr:HD domain-containing protein [Deltaproteobacteria bacterium]
MPKKQYVSSLKPGETVDDIFVLSEKNLGQKKDGKNYLNLTFMDRTGSLKGVLWDNVEDTVDRISAGDYVQVKGSVSEYRGMLQLVVRSAIRSAAEHVESADFLPVTTRNIDAMFEKLIQITDSLKTPCFHDLFRLFWADADLVRLFKAAPAAKKMHHAYIGGLLEHTLSMAILVDKIAGHYTGVDRDLLLAGAILHDIGKIREFEFSSHIDYTSEGRLLSHIVIGIQIIEEKMKLIKDFPDEQAVLLKHLVVSHHGVREFGSPELPKTIEAVLLNHIDEIDSKVKGIREFMASEDPNAAWTSFHKLLDRHFYMGKKG